MTLTFGMAHICRQAISNFDICGKKIDILFVLSNSLSTHAIQNMTGTGGHQRVPSECVPIFWLAVLQFRRNLHADDSETQSRIHRIPHPHNSKGHAAA